MDAGFEAGEVLGMEAEEEEEEDPPPDEEEEVLLGRGKRLSASML